MAGRGRDMVKPAWMSQKQEPPQMGHQPRDAPGGLQQHTQPMNQHGPADVRAHVDPRPSPRDRHREHRKPSRRRSRSHGRRHSKSRRDRSGSREPRTSLLLNRPRRHYFDMKPELGETVPPLISASHPSFASNVHAQRPQTGGGRTAVGSISGANQATKHARKLYIGGIEGVREDELLAFFQEKINLAMGREVNAVSSVYLNLERRFGFVELNDVELTTAVMEFDGIIFKGQPLKIRRPNDFRPIPPEKPVPVLNLAAVGIASTGVKSLVPEGPNKIFIGGLPYELSDNDIRDLLESFGKLKALHVVRDPGSANSKGYGFCEYMDPEKTQEACKGLDGLELKDRRLTVRLANQSGEVEDVTQMSAEQILSMSKSAGGPAGLPTADMMLNMPLPGIPSVSTTPPTRILVLMNMVTAEELAIEHEYQDIVDDIQEECAKFGRVLSIVVPKPVPGQTVPGLGRVFIEYDTPTSAMSARQGLEGREFAQRRVACDYLSEQKFAARDF